MAAVKVSWTAVELPGDPLTVVASEVTLFVESGHLAVTFGNQVLVARVGETITLPTKVVTT